MVVLRHNTMYQGPGFPQGELLIIVCMIVSTDFIAMISVHICWTRKKYENISVISIYEIWKKNRKNLSTVGFSF